MSHPLVSIVIPVRNGAKYLREAIDSALAQTCDTFEVLVVNDGSDDQGATEAIALSYGEAIRYFAKPNGGVASALNMGLENMKGEYFSWLSHDDAYLPEKLRRQVEYLSALPDKNVLLFSDYHVVNAAGEHLFRYRADHALLEKKNLYAVFRIMINGCTTLVRKDALLRAGSFRDYPATQDYDMWFRLSRMLPLCHLPEPLIRSRRHPEQGGHGKQAQAEVGRLWLRLVGELTEQEILGMENSREEFFRRNTEFFIANYPAAGKEVILYMLEQLPRGAASSCRRSLRRKQALHGLKCISRATGMTPYVKKIKMMLESVLHGRHDATGE
jgi:glycosyltransferase involved in cell wall biosynthesis